SAQGWLVLAAESLVLRIVEIAATKPRILAGRRPDIAIVRRRKRKLSLIVRVDRPRLFDKIVHLVRIHAIEPLHELLWRDAKLLGGRREGRPSAVSVLIGIVGKRSGNLRFITGCLEKLAGWPFHVRLGLGVIVPVQAKR